MLAESGAPIPRMYETKVLYLRQKQQSTCLEKAPLICVPLKMGVKEREEPEEAQWCIPLGHYTNNVDRFATVAVSLHGGTLLIAPTSLTVCGNGRKYTF